MSHQHNVICKLVEVTYDSTGGRVFTDFQTVNLSFVPRVGESLILPDSDEKGEGYIREIAWDIEKPGESTGVQSCSIYFNRGL